MAEQCRSRANRAAIELSPAAGCAFRSGVANIGWRRWFGQEGSGLAIGGCGSAPKKPEGPNFGVCHAFTGSFGIIATPAIGYTIAIKVPGSAPSAWSLSPPDRRMRFSFGRMTRIALRTAVRGSAAAGA